MAESDLKAAFDDAVARMVAIGALAGVAVVHALQLPVAFGAIDYVGVLFVLVVVACLVLAVMLTRAGDQMLWAAAGVLSALVLIAYIVSRTAGLPGFTEDIGDWTEPLGLASMVFEGMLVVLSVVVLDPRLVPTAQHMGRPVPGA